MAIDKEDIDLDLDDEIDWGDTDFNLDNDFGDGSQNKKDRKPMEALKVGLKEEFKSTLDTDKIEDLSDKIMPEKFTATKDDLKNYIREGKELYDESIDSLNRSVSTVRSQLRKAAIAYEKTNAAPKFLTDLLKKIAGKEKEREEEEYRRRTQEEENQAEITGALDDLAKAQIEMQEAAASREALQDQVQGKRFASQQELLFGISSGIRRATDYNEQVATKYYNNSIKIAFQQLHTQRAIYQLVTQSAEHQKQALDSIVKNTALPDIVKQKQSELMKDIAQRRLGNFVSNKLGDYVSGFKDQLIKNTKDTVKGAIDTVTGMVDMAGTGLDSMADAKLMEADFGEAKSLSENIGNKLGEIIRNRIARAALHRADKGGTVSRLTEKAYGLVRDLPQTANAVRDDWANSSNIFKNLIASVLPGYSEKNVSNTLNSRNNLTEIAEFDNATRTSIVDIIPQLLSRIHQSTEAIRQQVAPGELSDDNLLTYDHDNASFTTRSNLRNNLLKLVESASNKRQQIANAFEIVDLLDAEGRLSVKIKRKLATEIAHNTDRGKGFNPEDWLYVNGTSKHKWSKDFNEDEKRAVSNAISKTFFGEKVDEYDKVRRINRIREVKTNLDSSGSNAIDTVAKIGSLSSEHASLLRDAGLATINNGVFSTNRDNIFSREGYTSVVNGYTNDAVKKVKSDYRNIGLNTKDASLTAFLTTKGHRDITDEERGKQNHEEYLNGTIPNPIPQVRRAKLGFPDDRMTYKQWVEFVNSPDGQIYYNAKETGGVIKNAFGLFRGVAEIAGKEEGYDKFTVNATNKMNSIGEGISKVGKTIGGIFGLNKVIDKISSVTESTISGMTEYANARPWKNLPRNEITGDYDWDAIREIATSNPAAYEVITFIDNRITRLLKEYTNRTKKDPDSLIADKITSQVTAEAIKLIQEKSGDISFLSKTQRYKKKHKLDYVQNYIIDGTKSGYKKLSSLKDPKKVSELATNFKDTATTTIKSAYNATTTFDYSIENIWKQAKVGSTAVTDKLIEAANEYGPPAIAKLNEHLLNETGVNVSEKAVEIYKNIADKITDIKDPKKREETINEIRNSEIFGHLPESLQEKFTAEGVNAGIESLSEISTNITQTLTKEAKAFKESDNKIEHAKGLGSSAISKGKDKLNETKTNLQGLAKNQLDKGYEKALNKVNEVTGLNLTPEDITAINISKNEMTKFIGEVVTGKSSLKDNPTTAKLLAVAMEKKGDILNTPLVKTMVGVSNDYKSESVKLVKDTLERFQESNKPNATEKLVYDVYIKGENEPRLLARHLKAGKYVHLHGGKVIYSIEDIEGAIIDRDDKAQSVLISNEDIREKGLTTLAGESENTQAINRANNAVNPANIAKMNSWEMTKLIVRGVTKPMRITMQATDIYVINEETGLPELKVGKFDMMFGRIYDASGKRITKIKDVKGPLFNSSGTCLLREDELNKMVDVKGRKLSNSYIIRRMRLAKDWLTPIAKIHMAPVKFLGRMAKHAAVDVDNKALGGLGTAVKNGTSRMGSLLASAGGFLTKGFGFRRNGVRTEDGIAIDERTGKARVGNARDIQSNEDKAFKDRQEASRKRIEEEHAKRNQTKEDHPVVAFLKKWGTKLLMIGGPLWALFKNGISEGFGKLWDNAIVPGLKWIAGPLIAMKTGIWAVKKAVTGLTSGLMSLLGKGLGSVWDKVTGKDVDIDIDRRDKKSPKNKRTSRVGKLRNANSAIKKGTISTAKYEAAKQASKQAAVKGASKATQTVVAKQAAKTGANLAAKTATKAALKGTAKFAGRAALAALGPIGGAIITAWSLYELGSWLWSWKASPNKVDDFRIAAYGVNPENEYRASIILKLEEYISERTTIDDNGVVKLPKIDFANDKTAKEIVVGFMGGDQGRQIIDNMSEDELSNYARNWEYWYTNRFQPVFYQHAVTLAQIDKKLKVHKAFDRVGFNTLKAGLVLPWLRRAYFEANTENNPYLISEDPFIYAEGDDTIDYTVTGQEEVKQYFDIVVKAYKVDEESLRKDNDKARSRAHAAGKSFKGDFDWENNTTKYNRNDVIQSGTKALRHENEAKRILTNKDGSKTETKTIGETVYILTDVNKVNVDGRSVITDSLAIRLRLYGLTTLIETKVNTLLTFEKYISQYLTYKDEKTAYFEDFDFGKLFKTFGISFGWDVSNPTDEEKFKAWLKYRFSPVYLAYASLIKQLTRSSIPEEGEKLLADNEVFDVYSQLITLKTEIDEAPYTIFELPYSAFKDIEANTNEQTISVNLKNLELGVKANILTEPDAKSISKGVSNEPLKTNAFAAVGLSVADSILNISKYTVDGAADTNARQTAMANTALGISNEGFYDTKGGSINKYTASKKADKVAIAKRIFEEINKLGWSEVEKNHFLAQVTHETAGLKWLSELASGQAYEGRKDLGNVRPGDGPNFKGRGIIQTTGRANYQAFANWVGRPDIMTNPDIVAADPELAVKAGIFWWENKKKASKAFRNAVNNPGTIVEVSKGVNGGKNGLNDRIHQFKTYQAGKGVIREMAGDTAQQSQRLDSVARIEALRAKGDIAKASGGDVTMSAGQVVSNATAVSDGNLGVSTASGIPQTPEPENKQPSQPASTPGMLKTENAVDGVSKETVLGGGKLGTLLSKATDDLVEVGKKNLKLRMSNDLKKMPDPSKMQPSFMRLLYAAIGDYIKTKGKGNFGTNQMHRTLEDQKTMLRIHGPYNKGPNAGTGKGAAEPGKSNHGWGKAIDMNLDQSTVNDFVKSGIAAKWGFFRPLWKAESGKGSEWWHLENKFIGKPKGKENGDDMGDVGIAQTSTSGSQNTVPDSPNEPTAEPATTTSSNASVQGPSGGAIANILNGYRGEGNLGVGLSGVKSLVSSNPLESAANNGTYNDKTIKDTKVPELTYDRTKLTQSTLGGELTSKGVSTTADYHYHKNTGNRFIDSIGNGLDWVYDKLTGKKVRVGVPTASDPNNLGNYSTVRSPIIHSPSTVSASLIDNNLAKVQNANNTETDIGRPTEQQNLQTLFNKQGTQLLNQQRTLFEDAKKSMDAVVDTLKEQLTVQKESRDILKDIHTTMTGGDLESNERNVYQKRRPSFSFGNNNNQPATTGSTVSGNVANSHTPPVNMAIGVI